MEYKQASKNAWSAVRDLSKERLFRIKFLADEYEVDTFEKQILSKSCNIPAKEHFSIIILHYLIHKLKSKISVLPKGEWIDFRQLEGGEAYYPTFKKRTIDVILKKYGKEPDLIPGAAKRFNGKNVATGDIGVVINAFENVPILITIWRGDEEFDPEANVLFDETISEIFCTEDIVVLTEIITHSL